MKLILAFDPSISSTGWALLDDDGSENGRLLEAGRITTKEGRPIAERTWHLYSQVAALVKRALPDPAMVGTGVLTPAQLGRIVVEVPFTLARGGPKGTRSAMTLPYYGMAVGAVVCAALASGNGAEFRAAGEWSRGLPAVTGDEHKTRRVAMAAALWNRDPQEFGAKTVAGDVADAALLAWRSMQIQRYQSEVA